MKDYFLTTFYEVVCADPRIGATHISLYMAFFQRWQANQFKNPIVFTSREIMPLAKIDSRTTFHRCLRDLVEGGYIRYIPSCDPVVKCLVFLNKLGADD